MQSIWLENKTLSIREVEKPAVQMGMALVKVQLAGICNTDLELLQGYYPYAGVLGHEFVGVIEALQPKPDEQNLKPQLKAGQRVVGSININCHECSACVAGNINHCENRQVLGIKNHMGAFTDYLTLPIENLYHVPDAVADDAAVFVEPLAAALQILEQVSLATDDRVLVVGAGKLGHLIALVLNTATCNLTVCARRDAKLQLLRDLNIKTCLAADVNPAEFDVVVEASGNPAGFDLARSAVRPGGTMILKSTYAKNLELNMSAIVVDEITLIGSRCGPFDKALALLANDHFSLQHLISATLPLNRGLEAFELAKQDGVMKVLLASET